MLGPVHNRKTHRKALRRIEALWDAEPGTPEWHELDALGTLVDAYERKQHPIPPPDPIEAIRARCEELGWSRKELEPLIGSRARVSEILGGQRALTLPMIRRLHAALDIPAEVLIADGRGGPRRGRSSSHKRSVERRTPTKRAAKTRKRKSPTSKRRVSPSR